MSILPTKYEIAEIVTHIPDSGTEEGSTRVLSERYSALHVRLESKSHEMLSSVTDVTPQGSDLEIV